MILNKSVAQFSRLLTPAAIALLWFISALPSSTAAAPIDLEVAIERGAPGHLMPEWAKMLNEMGLSNVRLRSARASDQPSVEAVEFRGAKRYKVIGLLSPRNQLVLPGGSFGQGDRARLREYFQQLPARVDDAGVQRGSFGLTKQQFESLFSQLSRVNFRSTQGVKPSLVVAQLTEKLSTPIELDADAKQALERKQPITQELKGAATGMALAATLREVGLAMVPEAPRGQALRLRVAPLERLEEQWPVGWKSETVDSRLAPAMHQSKEIEIAGYSLDQAMKALERPLGVPVVYDQLIINRRKIESSKVKVDVPRRRLTIRRAVDRILSQARLTGELRVDEAGRAFYWVTQFGEDSPRATK